MLKILKKTTKFEQLASIIEPTNLSLINIKSCTFPSRPEPKQAQWASIDGLVLAYVYEPDLEIRYLWRCGPWPTTQPQCVEDFFGEHDTLFETWEEIQQAFNASDYPTMLSAIAATRLVAQRGKHRQAQARQILLDGLCQSTNIHARRAIADQLFGCATMSMLAPLQSMYEEDPDLQIRMHLHRIIDHLQARQMF